MRESEQLKRREVPHSKLRVGDALILAFRFIAAVSSFVLPYRASTYRLAVDNLREGRGRLKS